MDLSRKPRDLKVLRQVLLKYACVYTQGINKIHRHVKRNIAKGWKANWSLAKIEKHQSGDEHLYICSGSSGHAFFCIDIDGKGNDNLAGCYQFFDRVVKRLFPDAKCELSVSGKGLHSYITIKLGYCRCAATLKATNLNFQRKLNCAAKEFNLDQVEIKGSPLEAQYIGDYANRQIYDLQTMKAGCLIKAPRNLADFELFPQLPSLRSYQTLVDKFQPTAIDASYGLEPKTRKNNLNRSSSPQDFDSLFRIIDDQLNTNPPDILAIRQIEAKTIKVKPAKPELVADDVAVGYGSCDSLDIQRSDIVKKHNFAKSLLSQISVDCSSVGLVVDHEDLAVFLTLGEKFSTTHQNQDGTLPISRISAAWNLLYKKGVASRQFHHSRIAALRNCLSDLGMVTWTDNGYVYSGKKRRACRWSFSEELLLLLEADSLNLQSTEPFIEHNYLSILDVRCSVIVRPRAIFNVSEQQRLYFLADQIDFQPDWKAYSTAA